LGVISAYLNGQMATSVPQFRLSVLDQSPISEGSTGSAALRNSVDLGRFTESLG
jgi:hypothetical protein